LHLLDQRRRPHDRREVVRTSHQRHEDQHRLDRQRVGEVNPARLPRPRHPWAGVAGQPMVTLSSHRSQSGSEFSRFWIARVVPSKSTPSGVTPTSFWIARISGDPLDLRPVYFQHRGTRPLPSSVALYDWCETTPSAFVPYFRASFFQPSSQIRPSALEPMRDWISAEASFPNRPSSSTTFLGGSEEHTSELQS